MKDMVSVYVGMSSKQLKTLRSKKYLRIQKLEGQPIGYFNIQELRTLRQQLQWIDAVIESRDLQLELL